MEAADSARESVVEVLAAVSTVLEELTVCLELAEVFAMTGLVLEFVTCSEMLSRLDMNSIEYKPGLLPF